MKKLEVFSLDKAAHLGPQGLWLTAELKGLGASRRDIRVFTLTIVRRTRRFFGRFVDMTSWSTTDRTRAARAFRQASR